MELKKVLWFIIIVIHIHCIYLLDHDLTREFHTVKVKGMVSCIVCVCGYKSVTFIKGNARTANFLVSDATDHFWPRPVDCFLITKWETPIHTYTHTHTHAHTHTTHTHTTHTHTHPHTHTHTASWTPLNKWPACRRGRYLHNTQQTRETNIQALSGILTHNPSKREAADRRLRPHGHHRTEQLVISRYDLFQTTWIVKWYLCLRKICTWWKELNQL